MESHGWQSVAHLRLGGTRATDALARALHLKADGSRARRLAREVMRDAWAWDAHTRAAAAASVGGP
eukprot:5314826-Prymnesium_polylepis.1